MINWGRPRREGTDPVFRSAENHCVHVAHNPDKDHVRQYKVDGDLFPAGGDERRCDYLLLNDGKHSAYFIELKGSDLDRAVEQIENTVRLLRPELRGYIPFYYRIIYHTGTHSIQSQRVIKWKNKNKTAVIRQRKFEEKI